MVQKLLPKKRYIENLNEHCRPYFVYVTLLNFNPAALVKTFVNILSVVILVSQKSRHCFQCTCTTMAAAQEFVWFLVSFYVINVTFVEI